MEQLQSELEEIFKAFHRHPELSLREAETTRRIREILGRTPGVELLELGLPTGVLARVSGQPDGPAVALRADIDALPIAEEADLDYPSENPGVMHACGHDFHITALLGAARLLGERRGELPGVVYLLFQPAEETGSGAQGVVETGLFERYGIRRVAALHTHPGTPVGTVRVAPGAFSAAVDRFAYRIAGRGGHGGMPHNALDPIPPAARLVGAIQEILSRRIPALKAAVVSVTRITAGATWNIIPEAAELEGTARSFDPEVREAIRQGLEALAEGVRAEGYAVDFDWRSGCDATDNDPGVAALVRETALAAGFEVVPQAPDMSGEDFAFFQHIVPGALFHIGVGVGEPLHSPRYRADPAALAPAAGLLADVAARLLNEAAGDGSPER